jgi:hypothetical protein
MSDCPDCQAAQADPAHTGYAARCVSCATRAFKSLPDEPIERARARAIALIPHTQQRRAFLEGIEAQEGREVADAIRRELVALWGDK